MLTTMIAAYAAELRAFRRVVTVAAGTALSLAGAGVLFGGGSVS
ncbi:hypothetical protein GCM10023195_00440 [Actinoallomurus liliacearum]|uniref:ABC transporter permease n=1 Tax=Actinoallomurus liliacearum TaxID=1080073 RepID=A0ABP8T8F3_9ACTN